jgi:hypothetical protein
MNRKPTKKLNTKMERTRGEKEIINCISQTKMLNTRSCERGKVTKKPIKEID